MTNYNNFGDYLRFLRKNKNITLRKFAKRIGMYPTYLCDIELNRRNPPKNYIDKIIIELGIDNIDTKNLYYFLEI